VAMRQRGSRSRGGDLGRPLVRFAWRHAHDDKQLRQRAHASLAAVAQTRAYLAGQWVARLLAEKNKLGLDLREFRKWVWTVGIAHWGSVLVIDMIFGSRSSSSRSRGYS